MRVTRADLVDEKRALQTMVLCNNLEGPVDAALWEYARTRMPDDPKALADGSKRLDEEMFTSETKYMIAGQRLQEQDYRAGFRAQRGWDHER